MNDWKVGDVIDFSDATTTGIVIEVTKSLVKVKWRDKSVSTIRKVESTKMNYLRKITKLEQVMK